MSSLIDSHAISSCGASRGRAIGRQPYIEPGARSRKCVVLSFECFSTVGLRPQGEPVGDALVNLDGQRGVGPLDGILSLSLQSTVIQRVPFRNEEEHGGARLSQLVILWLYQGRVRRDGC